jgi:hypothetical protein
MSATITGTLGLSKTRGACSSEVYLSVSSIVVLEFREVRLAGKGKKG